MSLTSSLALPNLPGYKPHDTKPGPKKKFFNLVDGISIMKYEEPLNATGGSLEETSVLSIGNSSLQMKSKGFSPFDQVSVVLTFQAYFEEGENSKAEKVKIRKVILSYFLEDSSIQVVERPQVNSGLLQGTLIKRSILRKTDGTLYSPSDFRLGDELSLFGRRYRLVDCDASTRAFLRKSQGLIEVSALDVPTDAYEESRPEMQKSEFSYEKYKYKKNANSKYQEAALGIAVDNSGRAGFVTHGGSKLKFSCIWDNTQQLYGDMLEFSMAYSLADDSLEIFQIPGYNSGRDETFTRLLKKAKLPKSVGTHMLSGGDPVESVFYHWTEFRLGMELPVYGRILRIVDCDESTRAFYRRNGIELGRSQKPPKVLPIKVKQADEKVMINMGLPIGIESSEPKKRNGEARQIIFRAKLLSGGIDDVDRRFIISFYLIDDTIQVLEPPIRNSGFTGGTFLSRLRVKNEKGEYMTENDFYIGCNLRVLKHRFRLLDADMGTWKYMEYNSYKFKRSNFNFVITKIRPYLLEDAQSGRLREVFESFEGAQSGVFTKEGLTSVLDIYGLYNNDDEAMVSDHEIYTLEYKAIEKLGASLYHCIIDEIINPTGSFH